MNLRDAAAAFVEAGKALGRAEELRQVVDYLEECARNAQAGESVVVSGAYLSAARYLAIARDARERAVAGHQQGAARLIEALEHPGARLARRVLAAARAARDAWRAAR